MRRVDRTFGPVLCALLTGWRRIRDLSDRPDSTPLRRILIVKLAEQGAWVLASGAIADAIEMVGRDKVWLMTFADSGDVLAELDLVPPANLIEVDTSSWVRTMISLIRAVRKARSEGVDGAVDLEFFARSSAVLCFLSGARRRVGLHRSNHESGYRGDLHTHRLSYNARLHVAETFRLLVSALAEQPDGLPAMRPRTLDPTPPPQRQPPTCERNRLRELLRELLPEATSSESPPLILLNPNAGDLLPLRRWPPDRYVELAQALLGRYPDLSIAFTGSPSEAHASQRLATAVGSKRAISLGGRTRFGELLTLYSMADVLVTNDSGPAHYASMTDIDVVTLFGPESPLVFGSLSPRHHALWAALPCSPCVNAFNDRVSSCSDNVCMQTLTVHEVLDTVCEIYERRVRDRTRS